MPLHAFSADVPPRLVETPAPADLPPGWDDPAQLAAAQAFGTAWARSLRSPALRVPSAVVPAEWNAVLNPIHPAFPRLSIEGPRPFSLDPRLAERIAANRPKRRPR